MSIKLKSCQSRIPEALIVLCVCLSGCGVFDRPVELVAEETSVACLANEAAILGTWQTATVCNWAWGDGCRTIPVEERNTFLTFRDDGTCFWTEFNIIRFEAEYRLVPIGNRTGPDETCLLEIGSEEGCQTWSFTFAGSDTLTMGIMAKDAGVTLYVRIF